MLNCRLANANKLRLHKVLIPESLHSTASEILPKRQCLVCGACRVISEVAKGPNLPQGSKLIIEYVEIGF
ncbi:MAG TPA: hypothetical protein VH796_04170 [Nitrososphaeraceae archaeon]|jgi:ferredoxin-like protein FixX